MALLTKIAWRMLLNLDTLWSKVLWKKYGSPLVEKQWKTNVSHLWKGIILGASILKDLWGDSNVWSLSRPNDFSVKGCYSAIRGAVLPDTPDNGWKKIRKMKGPLRLNLQLWFASHGKLPGRLVI